MNLLALETSANLCSLALCQGDNPPYTLDADSPMRQSQHILPLLNDLLSKANLPLNHVDAIAFGCGPGSFTGIRIAASITQGLAFGLNIPVIPVSSLAALAQRAYAFLGWKEVLVAVDARMNEVYYGFYTLNALELMQLVGEEQVSPAQKIKLPNATCAGVGNAWEVYKADMAQIPTKVEAALLPTASAIIPIAKEKYKNGLWVHPQEALPVYLRDNVAHKKAP